MGGKRGLVRSLLRVVACAILIATVGAVGAGAWLYRTYSRDLPASIDVVTDYRPMRATSVWSANGERIGEFFTEKRIFVPIGEVPEPVKRAFVAAEDARFYRHHGIDYLGIARAAWVDLKARHIVQGGSTITQQVAKMLLVGQQRSFSRKAREAILARKIEKTLGKDQILGIYLNHVFFGHGAYGIVQAALTYFGKSVDELTVAEAALLAALPRAPSEISPFRNYDRARVRQLHVIGEMERLGFITADAAESARREPLGLVSKTRPLTNVAAPYFVDAVRQVILDRYGDSERLRQGLRIETTLDMRLQRAAEEAVRQGLGNWHTRHGFSGPMMRVAAADLERLTTGRPRLVGGNGLVLDDDEAPALLLGPEGTGKAPDHGPGVDPSAPYAAVVTQVGRKLVVRSGSLAVRLDPADESHLVAWRGPSGQRIAVGDVLRVRLVPPTGREAARRREPTAVLADPPSVEGALVALAPATGRLLAMVGGYDYRRSQFNRATQARRQVGSAIKPFVYAAAINKGMTELTVRADAPVKFKTSSGTWSPHNYRLDYKGAVTLRTALAESINTVAAQLVAQVGVDAVVEVMRALGITSKLPMSLSLALGTADLGLQEMAYALAGFATGGKRVTPVFITKVLDADGRVLEEAPLPNAEQRLDAETAYIVTDMMKGVVERGTGKQARELARPIAAKTGTATNYRDAWFFGFSPDLLCGVWVGRDDFKPIGHGATGGQVALPIWLSFMHQALAGTPVHDFEPPPGIVFVRADPESGAPVEPGQKNGRLIPFKRGTLPQIFLTRGRSSFSDAEF